MAQVQGRDSSGGRPMTAASVGSVGMYPANSLWYTRCCTQTYLAPFVPRFPPFFLVLPPFSLAFSLVSPVLPPFPYPPPIFPWSPPLFSPISPVFPGLPPFSPFFLWSMSPGRDIGAGHFPALSG